MLLITLKFFWGEIFMKMNKLFTSLATSAMVLSTVAPVAVANAAVDKDGVTHDSLPVTAYEGDGEATGAANEKNGATAFSDANVHVVQGLLTLEAVPSFGFGNIVPGGQKSAVNNEPSIAGDSVGGSALSVSDSRMTAAVASGTDNPGSPAVKGYGYNVNVSLGNFFQTGSSRKSGFYGAGKWKLILPSVKGSNTINGAENIIDSHAVTLTDGKGGQDIVTTVQGEGYGSTDYQFGGANLSKVKLVAPSEDELTDPTGHKIPSTSAKDTPLSAVLTWILTATAPTSGGTTGGGTTGGGTTGGDTH